MLETKSIRYRISTAFLLVIACVILGSGCAKIADPQPPEIRIPKPASDLAAQQSGDTVVLTLSKPQWNTNGSPATTLARVEVYRLIDDESTSGSGQNLPEEQAIRRATRVRSIPSSRFSEYLRDNVFVIRDDLQLFKDSKSPKKIRYWVVFRNNKNQFAEPGKETVITPVPIPPPPEGCLTEVTEDSINVKWAAPTANMDGSQPARIAGYNIYRSEDPGKIPSTKINVEPLEGTEFEDRHFQFGNTYYYRIGTVGSIRNPYAESVPSKPCTAVAQDKFSPAPPSDFHAILDGDTVYLQWSLSSSPDVAGYRIYRQEKGSKTRRILHKELITGFSFRDNPKDFDRSWEYIIQAVDRNGNESTEVRTELQKP